VIRDSTGNLYGTTYDGGAGKVGVVFKVDMSGQETVLCSFNGYDGALPFSGVIRDPGGNLYGTTAGGGGPFGDGEGVVYKLDPSGAITVLYAFPGGADGAETFAGVIRDRAGNLYGTTFFGGTADAGVVFELDSAGSYTVLYSFAGGVDRGNPYGGVIRDERGNLYGTTYYGGPGNRGVVFELKPQ
jgi:uncharacterized repeat protein (TIGR03803 family)